LDIQLKETNLCCVEVSTPLEKDETGTGILENSSTFYVYAETFKLLPHSLGRTIAELNKAEIILPNIEAVLRNHRE
jgi:hypothetical protein